MRTWAPAAVERRCGRCHAVIPVGALMLTIKLEGMLRGLLRCATCAPCRDVVELRVEDVPAAEDGTDAR